MSPEYNVSLEVASFNLADLNVDALDTRLELTTLFAQHSPCEGNCSVHQECVQNTGCVILPAS
jgi:hypothetical protein